jgi:hypothetical protein
MPSPRLVKNFRAAEEYAAEVLRAVGFGDASVTVHGSDGGVDVRASAAVAQVKMEALPTGRPAVQSIFGIAAHERKLAVFFSLAGYTAQAVEWARVAGVACFEFEFDGSVQPITAAARDLLNGSAVAPSEQVQPQQDEAVTTEATEAVRVAAEATEAEAVQVAAAALEELGPAPRMAQYPRFTSTDPAFRDALEDAAARFGTTTPLEAVATQTTEHGAAPQPSGRRHVRR